MPKKAEMSWQGCPNFRWRKRKDGKPYKITAMDLGFFGPDRTREKTLEAANAWWRSQLAAIVENTPPTDDERAIKRREELIAVAQPGQGDEWREQIKLIKKDGVESVISIDPLRELSSEGRAVWKDRLNHRPAVETTAKHHVKRFLDLYESKAKAKLGGITPGRFGVLRNSLNNFLTWFGETNDLTKINEQTVSDYFKNLCDRIGEGGKGNSQSLCSDHFRTFQQFIEVTAEDNPEIPRPKNLRSKKFQIARPSAKINPWTKDEFETFFKHASSRTGLMLLLMLNTSMQQTDLAELKATEVDWKNGRIIRSRSKLQKIKHKQKDQIKINWKLWPKTWELLQQHGNRTGLVFLTTEGTPIVQTSIVDGQEKRSDTVHSAFFRLVKKLKNRKLIDPKFDKTMKQLRKTGPNMFDKTEFESFIQVFLDHSSVAKTNYLSKDGSPSPEFDRAIDYLGTQFGFVKE